MSIITNAKVQTIQAQLGCNEIGQIPSHRDDTISIPFSMSDQTITLNGKTYKKYLDKDATSNKQSTKREPRSKIISLPKI